MATIYEELHALVDKLSQEEAERLALRLREETPPQVDATAWYDDMRRLRERIKRQHGILPSAAEILNELREERLDDLMGGR